MQVDLLIVGQGLCGSWLSYEAQRAGLSVCVLDTQRPNSPSRISAGIINPITGRRQVEVWLSDELLAHAKSAYSSMSETLNRPLIRQTTLIDFFPSDQMCKSFQDRIAQNGKFVSLAQETQITMLPFDQPHGAGIINPVFLIDLPAFLEGNQKKLIDTGSLLEEQVEATQLRIEPDGVRYKDIRAERIVFCEGTAGLSAHFFPNLPFAPNKGEVLILDIPGLQRDHLYKHGLMLAPLSDGTWWAGSSYQWSFNHPHPTPAFREEMERTLKSWLTLPFQVIDHRAGVRPATLERRPFVGFHPQLPRIGILNGMGTKGCSLAPFFARELIRHWFLEEPIHPEASIERFSIAR
ncbi:MAG: FAD-binding oxidoreductase [Bacteroidetes bacterium]|nr:FAD-binding oxidoreductase [Bacteroidota bacterium]